MKSWNSNSPLVDKNPNEVTADILRHAWNNKGNKINLKSKELYNPINSEFNNKTLMGVTARIWDPSGCHLPITIKYRIEVQQLWQEGLAWEEQVGPEQKATWAF